MIAHTHKNVYIYIHIHTSFFCIFKNSDDGGVVYICWGVCWDPPTWSNWKHAEIHVLVKLYINLDLIASFWDDLESGHTKFEVTPPLPPGGVSPKNPGWIAPSYTPNHRKQTILLHGSSRGICQQFHMYFWWNLDRFRCFMSCGFVFLMLLGLLIFVANQPTPPQEEGFNGLIKGNQWYFGGFC